MLIGPIGHVSTVVHADKARQYHLLNCTCIKTLDNLYRIVT